MKITRSNMTAEEVAQWRENPGGGWVPPGDVLARYRLTHEAIRRASEASLPLTGSVMLAVYRELGLSRTSVRDHSFGRVDTCPICAQSRPVAPTESVAGNHDTNGASMA